MNARKNLPSWLNKWVIIGSLAFCLFLLCLSFGLLAATRRGAAAFQPTAILEVIHAPTASQTSPAASPSPESTGASSIPPSPPPGTIIVGAHVQVVGTGGDGLRLRIEPSLEAQILMLGSESEVFRVHDGPREADGYTWWYLVGPFDSNRYGWAVANFLVVVQAP